MQAVKYHVQENKFSEIRELFDKDKLDQLGQNLESAKDTSQRQASKDGKGIRRGRTDVDIPR